MAELKPVEIPNGLTVKQLKGIIKDWPETNDMGEPCEVWMETGRGLSSPVSTVWPLNKRVADQGAHVADILFGVNK